MARSPFAIDWGDLEAVIAYAEELHKGFKATDECPGMVVYKLPKRQNYNITFASNLWRVFQDDGTVLHRTYKNN